MIIIIMSSIHQVLKAEKTLKKADLAFDLTPVPKEINPNCGMALEIEPGRAAEVVQSLRDASLRIEHVYRRKEKRYEEVDVNDFG